MEGQNTVKCSGPSFPLVQSLDLETRNHKWERTVIQFFHEITYHQHEEFKKHKTKVLGPKLSLVKPPEDDNDRQD